MSFNVIDNPGFTKFQKNAGFKNSEFRALASLYAQAASHRALYDMAVDVDFDDGTCTITYYLSNSYKPYLQFVILHVGPRSAMYEVFKEGKGKIIRSGLFDRAFDRLREEVHALMPSSE